MPTSASRALKNLSMSKMGVAHMGHENLQRERERYTAPASLSIRISEARRRPPHETEEATERACMGAYLSCFNISWKHSRCMVWPQRSTDVSLSESNRYCLAATAAAEVSNGELRTCGGRAQGADSMRPHLVADGAVVLHRVLDAAVPIAKGRRVAGSYVCKQNNRMMYGW